MKRQEKRGGRVFLSFQGSFYLGMRTGPEPLPFLYCEVIPIRELSHGKFLTNQHVSCVSNKTFVLCSLISLDTVRLWNRVHKPVGCSRLCISSTILK